MSRPAAADLFVGGVWRLTTRIADLVLTTPGVCQNIFSAPQKQPMPNMAWLIPASRGSNGPPVTWCVAGTFIASARPGKDSDGPGNFDLKSFDSMALVRCSSQWTGFRYDHPTATTAPSD